MKLTVIFFLCLVEICIGDAPSRAINFNACDAKSPGLNECLVASVGGFFQLLSKPDSVLREPLRAGTLILGPGDKLFPGRLTLSDIQTWGWGSTKFDQVTLNIEKQKISHTARTPALTIKSRYQSQGKLLGKDDIGGGDLTTVLDSVLWQWDLNYEVIEKNGNKHFRPYTSTVTADPEKVRFEFGNQDDNFNKQINENSISLYQELRGDYENILNAILSSLIGFTFDKEPIKTFILNY